MWLRSDRGRGLHRDVCAGRKDDVQQVNYIRECDSGSAPSPDGRGNGFSERGPGGAHLHGATARLEVKS